MLFRPISIIAFVFCLSSSILAQSSAIIDFSQSNSSLLIPRMDTMSMQGMNETADDDGLLVYTTDLKSMNYYDAILGEWIELKGRDGIDGANGVHGANGPRGPRGMARAGAAGPDGTAMITMLHCWDRDLDQIADPEDDVNNDGEWNTLDCEGDKGAKGSMGGTFDSNVISTNYIHITSEGTDESTINNPALSSTSKVFIQNIDFTIPMYAEFSAPNWSIKTSDASIVPAGTNFIIVIIN